ncbi:two-component system sensor histidine kinase NtrB [Rhizorhapis sp. SPR117]|uniref:two-component system sensor histidine kinase NtrB n=1 Tax=Rhizorhapis sp. SPR117 TaxID=2912611 RepID=UPI00403E98EE
MAQAPPHRTHHGYPDLADIFTAMPVAALIVAPDNRIMNANVRAESLFNMARSAIIGSDVARTIRIADMTARVDFWNTDKPLSAYDVHVHAGRMAAMEVDLMISPIAEHDGWRVVAIHAHSQAQNIAHRRAASGTAMGAAAILAHEIKNPLSGIRGAAQLLEASVDDDSATLTQLICHEVDRIAALIDRMQHFTTDQPLTCRSENIYPLLDRAVELAAAGFAKNVKLVRQYDPSLPFAEINGDAFVQIMLNLLKNAAEALELVDKGEILITTAFRHGVFVMVEGKGNALLPIEIRISDNGPGVPDHIREHLFSPFISGKRDGQGLGLALVDKLVRDMNGLVQYSREPDSGRSVFRILLPMARGQA